MTGQTAAAVGSFTRNPPTTMEEFLAAGDRARQWRVDNRLRMAALREASQASLAAARLRLEAGGSQAGVEGLPGGLPTLASAPWLVVIQADAGAWSRQLAR